MKRAFTVVAAGLLSLAVLAGFAWFVLASHYRSARFEHLLDHPGEIFSIDPLKLTAFAAGLAVYLGSSGWLMWRLSRATSPPR
jgi:hypothetical protein